MTIQMNSERGAASKMGQLLRPRYFPRQPITAVDLNAEQAYFTELTRRHNRFLHGCGIVCGLDVLLSENETGEPILRVTPGHAIGPQGDEILVDAPQSIPLADLGLGGECALPSPERRLYLALRYDEQGTQTAPVLPGPCTPVATCEFSRMAAGFQIACLAEPPDGCRDAPACGVLLAELLRQTPPDDDVTLACPAPPADPWVVLAALDLVPAENVVRIDYSVRRQLLSAQRLVEVLRCLVPLVGITPRAGQQASRLLVVISGFRLADASAVRFSGTGVSADVVTQLGNDNRVVAVVDIAADAPLGERTFQVTTPRGLVDSAPFGLTFTVLPRSVYGYPYSYLHYFYGYLVDVDVSLGIGGDLL